MSSSLVMSPIAQSPFKYIMFDDFIGSTTIGGENWNVSTAGTTTANNTTLVDDRSLGIVSAAISSGNTNNRGVWNLGAERLILANGECIFRCKVKFGEVDNVNDRLLWYIGLGDTLNGEHVDGVYFVLDTQVSANILAKTSLASTRSQVDTGVSITGLGTNWFELMFVVNQDATSVSFFVNNNAAGVINSATNIPKGAGRTVSPIIQFKRKISGNITRNCYLDYVYLEKNFLQRF